ncbi:hypothetical protein ADICYQ_1975 [Cyclobacterium qasimii M12-11B]|uniref:Uncharacterized protein n=1 Tax=Cyclobacterium qasimii M12-11B TaxID=641524 RepID=S7VFG0_9BACT|nr:hypothetical protein ADICYQ_1975 [Cyclobacterium qasimii M12-11B]
MVEFLPYKTNKTLHFEKLNFFLFIPGYCYVPIAEKLH